MLYEILSRLSEIATIGTSAEGFVHYPKTTSTSTLFFHFNLTNPISCGGALEVVEFFVDLLFYYTSDYNVLRQISMIFYF